MTLDLLRFVYFVIAGFFLGLATGRYREQSNWILLLGAAAVVVLATALWPAVVILLSEGP